jgi:hypothetical protein
VREGGARIEVEPPYPNTRSFIVPAPIDLAPDATEVAIVLMAGGAVTGTLIAPDGTAPPSSWIDVMRDGVRLSRVASSADGTFRVVVPATGLVSLVYGGPCSPGTRENTPFADLDGAVEGVAAGATNVILRLATGVSDQTLTVRVLSPDSTPVGRVQMSLSPGGSAPTRWQQTLTDGTATFDQLPRHEVRVLVHTPEGTDWFAPEALRVRPRGQEVTLSFVRGTRIEGVLVSGDPGKEQFAPLIVEAFVGDRSVGRMGCQLSTTSAETKFRVYVPATEPGPFRIVVGRPGGAGRPRGTADGVAPGAKDVRIELKPK